MMRRNAIVWLVTVLTAACAAEDPGQSEDGSEPLPVMATQASSGEELPTVLVYKSPSCGCCNGWVEHMREAGFEVDARNTNDLMSVKRDGGVPAMMSSCHTALIDGYVVEGHIPAEHVQRLLADRPDIAGIAAPGMPVGSPGMEGSNAKPYQIFSFDAQGRTAVYAEVDPR